MFAVLSRIKYKRLTTSRSVVKEDIEPPTAKPKNGNKGKGKSTSYTATVQKSHGKGGRKTKKIMKKGTVNEDGEDSNRFVSMYSMDAYHYGNVSSASLPEVFVVASPLTFCIGGASGLDSVTMLAKEVQLLLAPSMSMKVTFFVLFTSSLRLAILRFVTLLTCSFNFHGTDFGDVLAWRSDHDFLLWRGP